MDWYFEFHREERMKQFTSNQAKAMVVGLLVAAPLLWGTEATGESAVSWVEKSFADFADGQFDASGANLYVSAAGTMQFVNRWDVNDDGYIDFFFGNTHNINHTEAVWVYLDGRARYVSLSSSGAYRVAAADLNGDSYIDLIVGNRDNNVTDDLPVYVHWGARRGFADAAPLELPAHAVTGIAVADLNGDSRPELIVANESGDVSYIYWNGPNGLSPRERTDLATEHATAVATVDLNGDGNIDVIFANGSNARGGSFIYMGDGKNFTTSRPLVLETSHPVAVATGDLNLDGHIDLVFANSEPAETSDINAYIYWGRAGVFSNERRAELLAGTPADVAIADLDQNGYPDLVFASVDSPGRNWAGKRVPTESKIFWGAQEGYSLERTMDIPTYAATAVVAGDYNGNGWADLVFAQLRNKENFETESVVFLNENSGFDFNKHLKFTTRGATDVVMADFDGNGKPDLAFANKRSGNARGTVPSYLYLGGTEGYSADGRIELPSSGANQASFADFNDDGWTDVLVDNSDHDDPSLKYGARMFWGGKDGIVTDRFTRVDVDSPWASSVADFNRDGYLDILFSAATSGVDSLFVYWGGEDPYLKERRTVLAITDGRATAIADLNRDGYLDVVGTSVGESVAKVFWGGPAGFSRHRYQALPGFAPVSVEVADLNADGYADLIVCNFWDPSDRHFGMPSYIYWGSASGLSEENRTELLTYGAHDAAVADLNNDGHLDIVFSNYRTDESRDPPAYVYWGSDEGFDQNRRSLLPAHGAAGIFVADLNRDGHLDLVFANHTTNQGDHRRDSQILWGSTTGLHSADVTWLPGLGPHNMHTVDIGNRMTRELREEYVSSVHRAEESFSKIQLSWEGETPHGTRLQFQIRTAQEIDELSSAPWIGSDGVGSHLNSAAVAIALTGEGHQLLQYKVIFETPHGANSPLFRRIEVRYW